MNYLLPARADVGEWEAHLRDLSERAEKMLRTPKPSAHSVNAHAALAIDALKVLWAGWSPELVYASCQASLLLGAPVIAGRRMNDQLAELESRMAAWAEHDQQQPDPVRLQPVELLAPDGVLPPPQESKPRKPRRPRDPEPELEQPLGPELEPLELDLQDEPGPVLPDLWNDEPEPQQEPQQAMHHWDHPAADPDPLPPWLPTEPDPAPEPETISAIELANHFQKSLAWVNTLMNRREILKLGIHYRARRPGEPKGYKYSRDVTIAAIAESRQRAPRRERALEQLADQVLAGLGDGGYPQARLTVMPPVWIITMRYVFWPRN